MSVKDFIKEHKHLVDVLNKGSKTQRQKEANKQLKELFRLKK